ncbi:MAG: L-seryl-tRNA(Sec) selenium transferase [Deltaproteobacteria bacterium]|nr:L-seryl-tRNA(Sec) selenium transferase [Deltaproteobacteria bacterium]
MPAEEDVNQRLRRLPAVDEVLRNPGLADLLGRAPRWAVVAAVREAIERLRQALRGAAGQAGPAGPAAELDPRALEAAVTARLRPQLRRVINATGVVLHTNLGRAPLPAPALAHLAAIAGGYSNLEYDLERGARGSRHDHLAALLQELTGAEAAGVVNNNAAAVLLVLAALAAGREVVVSRGELIEIGGSFRLPDVMRAAGVRLREVGTTNRTHPDDYRRALGPDSALLLKVHTSNYAVVGFTAAVDVATLAGIGRAAGLPTVVDLGSGCLVDLAAYGLPREPTVAETLAAGADVCTFSGDKLLGGPQAGIICGRSAALAEIRRHPLMRAVRPDKLALAALEGTLRLYRDGREREIPALGMLATPFAELERRATALKDAITAALAAGHASGRLTVAVTRVQSAVGGGALPLAAPDSCAVALHAAGASAAALDGRLRTRDPAVVGRIADERLLLDARTLTDAELAAVAAAVAAAGPFDHES